MGIESIFSKSWGEFKKNILPSLRITFFYAVIPILVIILIAAILISLVVIPAFNASLASESAMNSTNGSLLTVTGNAVAESLEGSQNYFSSAMTLIFVFLLGVIAFVIFYFNQLAMLYISIYNEKGKLSMRQAVRGSLKYFWKYAGLAALFCLVYLGIVLATVLVSVFVYLIFKSVIVLAVILIILIAIAAICFFIYLIVRWMMSVFVLIRENTGIVESMRRSSSIVRGKWWMVFGVTLLFYLITSGISFTFSLILQILYFIFLGIFFVSLFFGVAGVVIAIFVIASIVATLFLFMFAITSLVMFLLLKNFYLELRTRKM